MVASYGNGGGNGASGSYRKHSIGNGNHTNGCTWFWRLVAARPRWRSTVSTSVVYPMSHSRTMEPFKEERQWHMQNTSLKSTTAWRRSVFSDCTWTFVETCG